MTESKRSKWKTWLPAGAAAFTIIAFLGTWAVAGNDKIHWQSEADADKTEIQQQHTHDIEAVLKEIADQKKLDRIQRNHRELSRLERDLIGEKYETLGEKEFIISEITRLGTSLHCDETGICIQ